MPPRAFSQIKANFDEPVIRPCPKQKAKFAADVLHLVIGDENFTRHLPEPACPRQ
jgi:hypothetical protein